MALAALERTPLQIVVKNSIDAWRNDLKDMLKHAKDRFPDVMWEYVDSSSGIKRRLWGHKAIIYARTSAKYNALHLYALEEVFYSRLPYASLCSINDLDRPLSSKMGLDPSVFLGLPSRMVHLKPPPGRKDLIRNLRLIYYAFEYGQGGLHDPHSSSYSFPGLNSLQYDLRFAWRARLSSDIQLQVPQVDDEISWESEIQNGMHVFWSHRFILASRSPYFLAELRQLAEAEKDCMISNDLQALTLPCPPFTATSLSFILDFVYTGTLNFANKTCDLEQAFAIYKGAKFLMINSLLDEIRTRIAEVFLHGLFHSALPREEYGSLIECKWQRMMDLGGCVCEQCVARLPQILELTLSGEVDDEILKRGVRRAAVGTFGEGWCSRGFTQLPKYISDIVLNDMKEYISPDNFFPLLFAAERGLRKLDNIRTIWRDAARILLVTVRDILDAVLLAQPKLCFECEQWTKIMYADRVGETGDAIVQGEETKWIFDALLRVFRKGEARELSEALFSSVLLRPDPTDNETPFLSHSSYIRNQVTGLLDHFLLSNIDLHESSGNGGSVLDGTIASMERSSHSSIPVSSVRVRRSRASSTSSISTYTREYHRHPNFIPINADIADDRSMHPSVSDSTGMSIFSYPSSRTVSTYYGFYYTRRALSMEMELTNGENHRLRRSASWSSFSSTSASHAANY